jgi:hypothetical protein
MNDPSQIGITIAGVAVVSALAAVVFNRLNTEPRFSRSSSISNDYNEYNDGTPHPLDAVDVPWSDHNRAKREAPVESEKTSDSNYFDAMGSNSSSQRSPERQSEISSLGMSQGSSVGSSVGSSFGSSQSSSERPSQNEPAFDESFDQQPSSTTPEGPPPPLPETPPGQQPGQQGMSGGARVTRCKHCHSRIKYTRRR